MRKTWIAVGLVAVFLAFAAGAGWLPLGGGPRCAVDDEIEGDIAKAAFGVAGRFFDAVAQRDAAAAYTMLAPGLKDAMTAEKFGEVVTGIVDGASGGFREVKALHAYHVERDGTPGRVICGNSETGVQVNALPGITQVHTLYSAVTDSHMWALTAWMTKRAQVWEVESFYITISGVAGRGPEELRSAAQAQAGKGHGFNAFMLMSAASATAYRGPDFQPITKLAIDAALAAVKVPPELSTAPPRKWKLKGKPYAVEQVTIVGAARELGLVIMYRDEAWDAANNEDGEVRNRALIDAFIASRPEVKEAFNFVVARILKPGQNVGWGTVYDAKRGYTTATAAEAAAAAVEATDDLGPASETAVAPLGPETAPSPEPLAPQ
jgi:hypothetical protein